MGLVKIAIRSINYYRTQVIYQFFIILLLCAVITGSLMTGRSVRTSLKRTALEKIGNTGIFISSGQRYFERNLSDRLQNATGLKTTGLLELKGSGQGLISQRSVNNMSIWIVDSSFCRFHNFDSLMIKPGEVFVNRKLASSLGLKEGDDVIIRFADISDIPADAPFAPSKDESLSMVLKTGRITDEKIGNFSLSISQVPSANIFMNIADLDNFRGRKSKLNRILIEKGKMNTREIYSALEKSLELPDIGLRLRNVKSTGEPEIISDRVFIDQILIDHIKEKIPSASPVITYLANRIENEGRINPYSFVSGLNSDIYPESPSGNTIFINKWLSDDISADAGDSITMTWFSPDSLNHLVEKNGTFMVGKVTGNNGVWADSMLMPDFPGISASESCSAWDAGFPIRTNLIREKDEDYWDTHKGTPKAFIGYDTAKELWGNNYGPATAIRFPSDIDTVQIKSILSGSLDPAISGFQVDDIYNESIDAAENSVDFGTLFLGLGFFLILASFVLLSFAVSFYFDLKKVEVRTMYALGFRNRTIHRLLLLEATVTAFAACIAGSLAGYLINIFLIGALNTVWTGAVQTNTLVPSFDAVSMITGFSVTLILSVIFMFVKIRRYLKNLRISGTKHLNVPNRSMNLIFLMIAGTVTLVLFVLSLFQEEMISLSFISGSMMLITFIFIWRQFWISGRKRKSNLSALYYSFYPSYAVTPVLFIAAGIFAVFITAVNRKNFESGVNDRSSGTGGYLLWMETSLPVRDDLNSRSGRLNTGMDDDSLDRLAFVQMKRSEGNDASCLNLNHIVAPPLLGVDTEEFIRENAFTFAKTIQKKSAESAWSLLETDIGPGVIYGIADQTVLDWGLKISVGDTLILRAENGQPLKIIIAAGLQSSVFQGYVLISKVNFTRYYPSVSGNSVFLAQGEPAKRTSYREILNDRFSLSGVNIENTSDRLAAFYEITNTYLSVFGVFGGLGMITGIAGLAFVLLRNFNRRKREFALMLATGFTPSKIKKMVFSEQILIIIAGIVSGLIPAIVATLPSLRTNHEIPWIYLAVIILVIFLTGVFAVLLSTRSIKQDNLISVIRKD
jgi:ABC-type antimicrobial peptide transport system permease subunit